ncbi:MAG: hypothetical protein ACK58T_06770, partial [Phycisphaerae bacterium]
MFVSGSRVRRVSVQAGQLVIEQAAEFLVQHHRAHARIFGDLEERARTFLDLRVLGGHLADLVQVELGVPAVF